MKIDVDIKDAPIEELMRALIVQLQSSCSCTITRNKDDLMTLAYLINEKLYG